MAWLREAFPVLRTVRSLAAASARALTPLRAPSRINVLVSRAA